MKQPLDLFVSCLPGIEPLLVEELSALGMTAVRAEPGGAAFSGEVKDVYRTNLECGLGTHVLVRLGSFDARSLGELVRKTGRLPWRDWVRTDRPLRVRVSSRQSRLYHTGAIEQRVRDGVKDALRSAPPKEGDGGSVVSVRFVRDHCTISLDTSGEPLHRRGWRLATGKAPVREDLARALLVASGWDRKSPLVDPFAGSGTIAVEAACLARGLPPGRLRSFAFEDSFSFDSGIWRWVREAASRSVLDRAPAVIVGSDRDAGAVDAARGNARRAGVEEDLLLATAPLAAAPFICGDPEPPAAGWIVTNPPFGKRVGRERRLRPLYQSLGRAVSGLPADWRLTLLAADRRLALASGLPLGTEFLTTHGGIKVRALRQRTSAGDALPAK